MPSSANGNTATVWRLRLVEAAGVRGVAAHEARRAAPSTTASAPRKRLIGGSARRPSRRSHLDEVLVFLERGAVDRFRIRECIFHLGDLEHADGLLLVTDDFAVDLHRIAVLDDAKMQ